MDTLMSYLLSHMALPWLIIGILAALVAATSLPKPRPSFLMMVQSLRYFVLFGLGGYGVYGFLLHAFFPYHAASLFAWPHGAYQWLLALFYFALAGIAIDAYRRHLSQQIYACFIGLCAFFGMTLAQYALLLQTKAFNPVRWWAWGLGELLPPFLLIAFIVMLKRSSSRVNE